MLKLISNRCIGLLFTATVVMTAFTANQDQAAEASQEAFICDWFGDPDCTQDAASFGGKKQ